MMTMERLESFRWACDAVMTHCPDPYAKSYARAGMRMTGRDEVLAQIPYIVSNIGRWRGQLAGDVRRVLKEVEKESMDA